MKFKTTVLNIVIGVLLALVTFWVVTKLSSVNTNTYERPKAEVSLKYEYMVLQWHSNQLLTNPLIDGRYSKNGSWVSQKNDPTPVKILEGLGAMGWQMMHETDSGEVVMMLTVHDDD